MDDTIPDKTKEERPKVLLKHSVLEELIDVFMVVFTKSNLVSSSLAGKVGSGGCLSMKGWRGAHGCIPTSSVFIPELLIVVPKPDVQAALIAIASDCTERFEMFLFLMLLLFWHCVTRLLAVASPSPLLSNHAYKIFEGLLHPFQSILSARWNTSTRRNARNGIYTVYEEDNKEL